MESVLKDETESDGASVSLQRTLTPTPQDSKETDSLHHNYETPKESETDLLDNSQQSSLEMLTSEIKSSGTEASIPPCNKGMTGYESHDPSPSNDNTDRVHDVTLSSNLEMVNALIETVTQERHSEIEERHLSKQEKVSDFKELGCQETSSDEWETASEESISFEENVKIDDNKMEKANEKPQCNRKEYSYSQEETVGPLHMEISSDNKETVNEDIGSYLNKIVCEETHSNEAISRDETVAGETAAPVGERVAGETAAPVGERVAGETAAPVGERVAGETAAPVGERVAGETAAPDGETVAGETAAPVGERVAGETAAPDGETVAGETAAPVGETVAGETAAPVGETVAGETAAPVGETVAGETAAPVGETVAGETAAPVGETVAGETAAPVGETVAGETAAPVGETVAVETAAPVGETVAGETAAPVGETVAGETAAPVGETVAGETAAPVGETVAGETAAPVGETVAGETAAPVGETVAVETAAPVGETVAVETAAPAGETVAGETAAPVGETVAVETAAPAGETVAVETAAPAGETVAGETAAPAGEALAGETAAPAGEALAGETAAPAGEALAGETAAPAGEALAGETAAPAGEALAGETAAPVGETVAGETAAPVGETVAGETAAPAGEALAGETAAPAGETVSQEFEGDYRESISEEKDNIEAVSDKVGTDLIVTVNEETADGKIENFRIEVQVDKITVEEKAGAAKEDTVDDLKSDMKENASKNAEIFNKESVSEELEVDCKETVAEETQGDCKGSITEEMQGDKVTVTEETHGVCKETLFENTVQEISWPESKETGNEEITSSIVETSEENRDQNEDTSLMERVITEPSSEEREVGEKRSKEKCNDQRKFENPMKLSSETSEIPEDNKRDTVKESATNENETENDGMRSVKETSNKQALTENIESMCLQNGRHEEKPEETALGGETNLETSEEPSGEHPDKINYDTTLEMAGNKQVTINKDPETSKGSQVDVSGQLPLEVIINEDQNEMGQADKAKYLDNIATNVISAMLSGSEYMRAIDPPCESSDNVDVDNKLEEQKDLDAHVALACGQGLNEPYSQQTDSICVEQSTRFKDTSSPSFQKEIAGDQEPLQEDMQTVDNIVVPQSRPSFSCLPQELSLDEPNTFNQAVFLSLTFKDTSVLSESIAELISRETAQSLSQEDKYTILGDGELIAKQETSEMLLQEPVVKSSRETIFPDSCFSYGHPIIDSDQGTMASESEIGKDREENGGINNIKLLYTRQRSNTDPCRSHDLEESANMLQAEPQVEGSGCPRGRLRCSTPPFDNFTSSLISTSPQTVIENKMEAKKASILYPIPDENLRSACSTEDTTSKKEYTFFPTQIFNPMLLLSHTSEEAGFYHEKATVEDAGEGTNQGRFRSSPRYNQVLLRGQQPDCLAEKPGSSLISAEETSNTKPPFFHPVAPVWLPPRRSRQKGDTGGANDYKSMRTQENALVRRATIRHKKNTPVVYPAGKRFSAANLPTIPQQDYSEEPRTSNLQKNPPLTGTKVQISPKSMTLPRQQNIYEDKEVIGQPKNVNSMDILAEEEESTEKEKISRNLESVVLRGKRSQVQTLSSDSSRSIHRRYSTLINSPNLLYQEYSDGALNQEIERQKPGDSPVEEKDPGSPRLRRRLVSSQDSYLQRLSISSADSLWQDIPKVRDSVTFMSMTREEQKLQEAKFELIMSEALYLRSLNIAVDHFQRSPELQEVLSAQDRQWLFSRLSEVRDASSDFLFDLEEEFENNMYNFQVCDVVIYHEPHFRRVYLPYVTNQSYQDKTFQRLMNGNPKFQHVLAKLERDSVCQRLSLKSFLILPFQRITRLRLLLQNILKRSAPGPNEELQATEAHNALEKLIRDCNESVQRMKDTEELILLNQKIQFECKIFPLISQSRRLVKHGEVTSLEFNFVSFKSKVATRPVYLHLFNDCLLLSRVREGGRFVVFDHSSEFRVERCEIKLHSNQKNIFRVFLRDSAALGRECPQDVRETEYIFRTETQSQKLRWICALSPPKGDIDFLRVHGLSQMQCLKSYKSRENDELSLEKADILMITQSSDDGWLHGVRLSDLQSGWFPMPHVQPISRNACIRNLLEEQRLQNARAKLQPTAK